MAEREPFEGFVFRRVGPDGVKWLSSSGVPFFDDAGAFGGYRGIGRDLTPQYLIAEQAEMLGAVIDDVDEMVAIWDGQDRLVYCNRAFKEVNPGTEDILVPGVLYEDYLRAGTGLGLFPDSIDDPEAWIEWRIEQHRNPGSALNMKRQDTQIFVVPHHHLLKPVNTGQ